MNKETIALQKLLNYLSDSDRKEVQDKLIQAMLMRLPEASRKHSEAVLNGEKLPSFMSDIVAKKLFDAEEHRDRLQYLFREISGDDTIVVDSSFRNEGYIQSSLSKKVIFDIASSFHDGRIGVAEFQVAALNYTFERIEIYGSNMLMLQYSVNDQDEKKSELHMDSVNGVLLIYLMLNSPRNFKEFKTERYIHRYKEFRADSGLPSIPLVQKVFVQLDKCLEQFLKDEDGQNNQQLQIMLSLLADSSNSKVIEAAQKYAMLKDMIDEARMFVQNKEVQAMYLMESLDKFDLNALKSYEREEGREEGSDKHLIKLIRKKVEAGKDIQTIAAEVEESVETVSPIYDIVREHPEYAVDSIYDELNSKNSK